MEEGIVARWRYCADHTIPAVEALLETLEGDEKTGVKIVRKAIEEPVRQIATNAGLDGAVIIDKIVSSGKVGYGYDAAERSVLRYDPQRYCRSCEGHSVRVAECGFCSGDGFD